MRPGGEEDALEGLGELAQLTVTNEADATYDVSFTHWKLQFASVCVHLSCLSFDFQGISIILFIKMLLH